MERSGLRWEEGRDGVRWDERWMNCVGVPVNQVHRSTSRRKETWFPRPLPLLLVEQLTVPPVRKLRIHVVDVCRQWRCLTHASTCATCLGGSYSNEPNWKRVHRNELARFAARALLDGHHFWSHYSSNGLSSYCSKSCSSAHLILWFHYCSCCFAILHLLILYLFVCFHLFPSSAFLLSIVIDGDFDSKMVW